MKQDILSDTQASRSSDVLGSRTFTFSPSHFSKAVPVKILVKPSPKPSPSTSLKPSPSPTSTPKPSNAPSPSPSTTINLLRSGSDLNSAVNEWRKARGQSALATDDRVCKAVGERAREIATDFSHNKFMDAIGRNNIDYKSVSEIIAMNSKITVEKIVDQWDKSPSHHESMIGDFNYGCGAIVGNYAAFILLKK